jgi:glyoxylase-like metal-dependent hydrolase (beta-lactamase superfamily II)
MVGKQGVYAAPEMSSDPRIRVFRRVLTELADFEGIEVDAYVIIGEETAIFLDTLLCPHDMSLVHASLADELGSRRILCVNSHADWDHAWGNDFFSGVHAAPVLAHEQCRQRMLSQQAHEELAEFQAQHSVFQQVVLKPPTMTFSERLTIHAGDLTIELLHAPGHCQDQIVAWLPETGLLLAFDAVEYPLPCIEDAAGAPLMFATLERLAALHARQVLCSHGKTTSPTLIQQNLAYLRTIEQRCRPLLASHGAAEADLAQVEQLIGYPFDEAIGDTHETIDRTFYHRTHQQNIHAILNWLAQ